MGNEHQTRSRFRSANILCRLQGVSLARSVIQVPQSQDASNNGDRNGQTRRQSLRAEVCCFVPGTPLSPRPVGHRSSRLFRSVAGLRYLFQQHLSQPLVRAGLPPKEAPNDQSHEGEIGVSICACWGHGQCAQATWKSSRYGRSVPGLLVRSPPWLGSEAWPRLDAAKWDLCWESA